MTIKKEDLEVFNQMIGNDNMFAADSTNVAQTIEATKPHVSTAAELNPDAPKFSKIDFIKAGVNDLFGRPLEGGVFNNIREDKPLINKDDTQYKFDRGSYTQGDNLMNYVNNVDLSEDDLQWIRNKVSVMGSSSRTAFVGEPTPIAAINTALNIRGEYYGQSMYYIDMLGNFDSTGYNRSNKRWNVKEAPDLLNIHLGFIDPKDSNLKETSLRPSGGYPFPSKHGKKMEPVVYSANDYIHFAGFRGSGTNKLYADLMDLKPGQILTLSRDERKDRGVQISSYQSIDFGESSWSIGKTKDGQLYLAFADSWDFKGGELGPYGDLMDQIGVNDLHFYGRFPISQMHFILDQDYLTVDSDFIGN